MQGYFLHQEQLMLRTAPGAEVKSNGSNPNKQ